jgi:hypothetical protein
MRLLGCLVFLVGGMVFMVTLLALLTDKAGG